MNRIMEYNDGEKRRKNTAQTNGKEIKNDMVTISRGKKKVY